MLNFIRLLAVVVASVLIATTANAKRVALVIGNDNYIATTKLFKARNDADAMARELRAAGFAVQLHKDLNYREMVKTIDVFANSITGGDEVVVFFAGHGVQIKSGNYLLPVDIEAESESQVEKTAYGLLDLTDKLSEAKAAFSLVVVDACRDNPLKSRGRSVGLSRGLSAIEPAKGQMIVYSASRGQSALDRLNDRDPNPNSVFTREFISKMKVPGVKIEDIVRSVQDSVEALAKTVSQEQRPALYNESRGNFYFYGPTSIQVAPTPNVAPEMSDSQREDKFWDDAKAAGNKEAYEAYLESYPRGRYVSLARANIARLAGVQAATQSTKELPVTLKEKILGTWMWDGDEKTYLADNSGIYFRFNKECFRFTYSIQSNIISENAMNSHSCGLSGTRRFKLNLVDANNMELQHVESNYLSKWVSKDRLIEKPLSSDSQSVLTNSNRTNTGTKKPWYEQ
jgi:hypothetical protein